MGMALRDFTDSAGREWRVWDVSAEAIHPATRGEDYMRNYLGGWLAFESVDGEAKCRLTPIPAEWPSADVAQLVAWLHEADAVRGERGSATVGSNSAEGAVGARSPADGRTPVRTFRFPGGRFWTVTECEIGAPAQAAARREAADRRVLRFMSGSRALDVTRWPRDWSTRPDVDLAELLAASFPRQQQESAASEHQRRSSDGR
jgi:hypothetical protein